MSMKNHSFRENNRNREWKSESNKVETGSNKTLKPTEMKSNKNETNNQLKEKPKVTKTFNVDKVCPVQ